MKYNQLPWYADGASGKIGKKVFYQRSGQVMVRKAPGSYNVIPTEKQATGREKFIAAVSFAKSIIADPVLKALYTQKADGKRTAYAQAVSEFMMNPLPSGGTRTEGIESTE